MNGLLNHLAGFILQKNSVEECTVEELEQLTEKYSYFNAAHLLLTKKKGTAEKKSLFFHNPFWLSFLLQLKGQATIINPEPGEKSSEIITQPAELVLSEETISRSTATAPQVKETVIKEVPVSSLKIEALDPAKAQYIFEPYYTVDYFASQGIRFKEEDKPKDKFSQQLKSFTEWLKAMKRLPAETVSSTVTTSIEQKVDQMAEHSLQDRDVVTEAMAEVWEKQGNMAKAIEVYDKLSLLDPSKNRYFAAKIEDLKKIN